MFEQRGGGEITLDEESDLDWLRSEFSDNPLKVKRALSRELSAERFVTLEEVSKLKKEINIADVSGEPVMASSTDNILLKTTGVFTCVGLTIDARDIKRGGMVHFSPGDNDRSELVIEAMHSDLVEKQGARLKDLRVSIITGFAAHDPLKESISRNLEKFNLPEPEDDIWGRDRNILYDVKTGERKEILYPDTISRLKFLRKELHKIVMSKRI